MQWFRPPEFLGNSTMRWSIGAKVPFRYAAFLFAASIFSNYTFKFIWKSILVVLVFVVPATIVGFVVGYAIGSLGLANSISGFIPVFILLYLALVAIYFVRVSIILPATAVEQDNTFKKAFQITKNNFWRMFLIYAAWILISILYLIIFFVFEISTILPRYITATLSDIYSTTDKSCAINK